MIKMYTTRTKRHKIKIVAQEGGVVPETLRGARGVEPTLHLSSRCGKYNVILEDCVRHICLNNMLEGTLLGLKHVGEFDLGGITLSYGLDDNQGMDKVFLTVIQADGSIKPVERLTR